MGVGKGPGIKAPKYCGLQPLQKQMSWKLQQAALAEPLKLLQLARAAVISSTGSGSSPTDRQHAIKEQDTVGIS